METIIQWTLALFFILLFGSLYFLPAIISISKQAQNAMAIFFLNLVLGWTLIGWLATFIWACVDKTKNAVSNMVPTISPNQPSQKVETEPPRILKTLQPVEIQLGRQSKIEGNNVFSLILNFLLMGLLIFYLVYPSWILRHRYQAIQLFQNIFQKR